MKQFFAIAGLMAVLAAGAFAQSGREAYNAVGTIGFGFGGRADRATDFGKLMSFVGGGEGYVWKGLALGGDGQFVWQRDNSDTNFGLLAIGPSYHFDDRENPRKIVPFVTGGYGLAFRDDALSLYQLGGGVTWWPKARVGLRFEYRYYDNTRNEFQMNQLRFSVSFRD